MVIVKERLQVFPEMSYVAMTFVDPWVSMGGGTLFEVGNVVFNIAFAASFQFQLCASCSQYIMY